MIGSLVLILLAATSAGDRFGRGRWWASTRLVQDFPALR